MKILYLTKPCFGDCDFPLVKALMEKGCEVIMLEHMTPHSMHTTVFDIDKLYGKSTISKATTIYPQMKVFERYMPLNNVYISNEPTGHLGWKGLLHELKELLFIYRAKADVIICVENPNILQALYLWLFRKKIVTVIHDGQPHFGAGTKRSWFVRNTIKRYVRKFILLNKTQVELFCKGYNIDKNRVYKSHLGYYDILNMFGNTKEKFDSPYILFFGRITKYKGVENLLDAMKEVHKEHKDHKLIIAGSGELYFGKEKYKDMDYVEYRNRYIGLDEMTDLVRHAEFCVCPYVDASQSGVINTAFALETPVIATMVGGLPDMIDDKKTGLLVPPKDSVALTKAINILLDDTVLLKSMKENIKQSAFTGVGSWKSIANEYLEVIKTLYNE